MSSFAIYPVTLSSGTIAISPIPGRGGAFEADFLALLNWNPDLVVSMTTADELHTVGAGELSERLGAAGTQWMHLPIPDFGAPSGKTAALWPVVSNMARAILAKNGRVLFHCFGGQGRSGMAAMRLMVETGIPAEEALAKIRAIRPKAVETEEQQRWASKL